MVQDREKEIKNYFNKNLMNKNPTNQVFDNESTNINQNINDYFNNTFNGFSNGNNTTDRFLNLDRIYFKNKPEDYRNKLPTKSSNENDPNSIFDTLQFSWYNRGDTEFDPSFFKKSLSMSGEKNNFFLNNGLHSESNHIDKISDKYERQRNPMSRISDNYERQRNPMVRISDNYERQSSSVSESFKPTRSFNPSLFSSSDKLSNNLFPREKRQTYDNLPMTNNAYDKKTPRQSSYLDDTYSKNGDYSTCSFKNGLYFVDKAPGFADGLLFKSTTTPLATKFNSSGLDSLANNIAGRFGRNRSNSLYNTSARRYSVTGGMHLNERNAGNEHVVFPIGASNLLRRKPPLTRRTSITSYIRPQTFTQTDPLLNSAQKNSNLSRHLSLSFSKPPLYKEYRNFDTVSNGVPKIRSNVSSSDRFSSSADRRSSSSKLIRLSSISCTSEKLRQSIYSPDKQNKNSAINRFSYVSNFEPINQSKESRNNLTDTLFNNNQRLENKYKPLVPMTADSLIGVRRNSLSSEIARNRNSMTNVINARRNSLTLDSTKNRLSLSNASGTNRHSISAVEPSLDKTFSSEIRINPVPMVGRSVSRGRSSISNGRSLISDIPTTRMLFETRNKHRSSVALDSEPSFEKQSHANLESETRDGKRRSIVHNWVKEAENRKEYQAKQESKEMGRNMALRRQQERETSLRDLKKKTTLVRDKLSEHRTILDRFLPLDLAPRLDVQFEIEDKCDELIERLPHLQVGNKQDENRTSESEKSVSVKPYAPANFEAIRRRPSLCDYKVSNSLTPKVSKTRKRARSVLCMVKNDPYYFHYDKDAFGEAV